jgi:hypothetical protein
VKAKLYNSLAEDVAYKKGFQAGSLDALEKQIGTEGSKEYIAFWHRVFDRAQYEINRSGKKTT